MDNPTVTRQDALDAIIEKKRKKMQAKKLRLAKYREYEKDKEEYYKKHPFFVKVGTFKMICIFTCVVSLIILCLACADGCGDDPGGMMLLFVILPFMTSVILAIIECFDPYYEFTADF
jgi:ABC-type transport system involved in cytochrome bd biosynthesis fused ATPase/permease subunit